MLAVIFTMPANVVGICCVISMCPFIHLFIMLILKGQIWFLEQRLHSASAALCCKAAHFVSPQ